MNLPSYLPGSRGGSFSSLHANSADPFPVPLPLVNPIVHGDGVGYYAYVRAPLIQHNLRFEEDWRHANLNFSQSRTTPNGELLPNQYTQTGHVSNQFTVRPAILCRMQRSRVFSTPKSSFAMVSQYTF